MQAAAVNIGEHARRAGRQDADRAPSHSVAIGAIGAVLLTYWAALAFVTRRGAIIAALLMCSSVLLGVEARLAKTDAMLLAGECRGTRRHGAGLSRLATRRGERHIAVACARHILDSAGGGHSRQGAADPDAGDPADDRVGVSGQVDCVVVAAEAAAGRVVDGAACGAVVRSDFDAFGRQLPRRIARPGYVQQGRRRTGIARRAPAFISCCSGSRSGRVRCWRAWPHRRCGRRDASRARSSCWHGLFRHGSSSNSS